MQKEQSLPTAAVYAIRRGMEYCAFYTEHAGGFSYPYAALQKLDLLAKENPKATVIELAEMLVGSDSFPPEAQGKTLLRPISGAEAQRLLDTFGKSDSIPFHIQLDLDDKDIIFGFNSRCVQFPHVYYKVPVYGRINETSQLCLAIDQFEKMERGEECGGAIISTHNDPADCFSMFKTSGCSSGDIEAYYKMAFEEYTEYLQSEQEQEQGQGLSMNQQM